MLDVNVEIVQGRVRVNEVRHLIAHEDVHIFEVDLFSKYPGKIWETSTQNELAIAIEEGDDTLHTDTSKSFESLTWISFVGKHLEDWVIVTSGSRYTVRVAMYRSKED